MFRITKYYRTTDVSLEPIRSSRGVGVRKSKGVQVLEPTRGLRGVCVRKSKGVQVLEPIRNSRGVCQKL